MDSIDRGYSLLGSHRPPRLRGVLAAVVGIAAATLLVYPLRHHAPVVSLVVVYLPAVVLVSMFWGLALGVATAVASVGAFSYFHLPPVGRLTIADSRDWTGLAAFVVVAVVTGVIAELARTRAQEANQRRREADLAAELARVLLGAMRLADALPVAGERIAHAVGAGRATIELADGDGGGGAADGHAPHAGSKGDADSAADSDGPGPPAAIPLGEAAARLGTLHLSGAPSDADAAWISERVVPSLESVLGAAMHREALSNEVVETAALRRSDEMKTALLRSVSHDLRTPVTAILTAIGTLDGDASERDVREVHEVVRDAATRLWVLIEKLLDLSLLQAGVLAPRGGWYSLEEVLGEAIEDIGSRETFKLGIAEDLPLLHGDAAQLERAFANVLENAVRFSAGQPVWVRAKVVGKRVRVRIVDQGPGLPSSEHERIFLPFYRTPDDEPHHGSGLGLAIARGFIEVNGGRIDVESVPGQGTSFVVEFPLADPEAAPTAPPAEASLA